MIQSVVAQSLFIQSLESHSLLIWTFLIPNTVASNTINLHSSLYLNRIHKLILDQSSFHIPLTNALPPINSSLQFYHSWLRISTPVDYNVYFWPLNISLSQVKFFQPRIYIRVWLPHNITNNNIQKEYLCLFRAWSLTIYRT